MVTLSVGRVRFIMSGEKRHNAKWMKGTHMGLQTESEFTLPHGYKDREGNLHRKGVMRLATAADEILPMRDPRVQNNPAYLSVVVLSRVIMRLGTLTDIGTGVVEGLFAGDLAFLQDMYQRINSPDGDRKLDAVCPQCGCRHQVPFNFAREN